jgi:hypothetical protein
MARNWHILSGFIYIYIYIRTGIHNTVSLYINSPILLQVVLIYLNNMFIGPIYLAYKPLFSLFCSYIIFDIT